MDTRLKTRWVKALRSGKYKQGTGYLRVERGDRPAEYCCLGVLCELMKQKPASGGGFYLNDTYSNSALPVRTDACNALPLDAQDHLMSLNDGDTVTGIKRRGFRGIALWIERNL